MKNILSHFKGDKPMWAFITLLALSSFMPVFSASTNLVHVVGKGTVVSILVKHMFHILMGLLIIFATHKVKISKVKYFAAAIWTLIGLGLIFTNFQGATIGGANASRWVNVPWVNISFQPSALGWIGILMYVAYFLSKYEKRSYTFKHSLLYLWAPVFFIILPIVPSNLSTAAIIFFMVCLLLFVGKYPIKYFAKIFGILAITFTFFILIILAFPQLMPSRLSTWQARIERFSSDDKDVDRYQIENAKIALAKGEMFGVGPGKSIQKNFLPQSSSDFIYAIIGEEFGFLGATTILFMYILLMYRILVIANRTRDTFSRYLVVGLGFSIIIQAIINMGVAVEIMPTTGQPLPLISSGGTSIWVTCFSIGIILAVSRIENEARFKEKQNVRKKEEFKSILEDQQYDEPEDSQPMNAVLNK